MSIPHVQYLLVGGGVASASAAEAVRKIDPHGELMLIGQEPIGPYYRPPLSKEYLRKRTDRHELFTQQPPWYAEHQVQLRTGARAARLDTARRIVTLESSEEISFESLLIATGISPIHLQIPGADLPGLYYLRTADDADRIHNAIDQLSHTHATSPTSFSPRVHAGSLRVSILGAGVLGVELAATLTQLGAKVDLFASRNHPWHKFAGDHTGRFITSFLESHGVTVHANTPTRALEGDGRVQRVRFDDANGSSQTVPCDFAIAAVGAAFNRDLLRGTPIRCEKSILVDAMCRTNVEGIFAAGDCCAIFDPLFGKHRVLDHVDGAITTGTIAGTNMAGGKAAYDAVNVFDSAVFDLKLNAWGEASQVDRRLIRTSKTDPSDFIEIGLASDGRITQIVAINHPERRRRAAQSRRQTRARGWQRGVHQGRSYSAGRFAFVKSS